MASLFEGRRTTRRNADVLDDENVTQFAEPRQKSKRRLSHYANDRQNSECSGSRHIDRARTTSYDTG